VLSVKLQRVVTEVHSDNSTTPLSQTQQWINLHWRITKSDTLLNLCNGILALF